MRNEDERRNRPVSSTGRAVNLGIAADSYRLKVSKLRGESLQIDDGANR